MLVAGVDEAGRGPVIGPLVIAGVMFEEADLSKLIDLGVKDSKLLTSQKRETLAAQSSSRMLRPAAQIQELFWRRWVSSSVLVVGGHRGALLVDRGTERPDLGDDQSGRYAFQPGRCTWVR